MENSQNCWEALRGNQQASQPTSVKLWREASETIMGTPPSMPFDIIRRVNYIRSEKFAPTTKSNSLEGGDGIVHSIWKQMANIKEARDLGAIPSPGTKLNIAIFCFF
jgi:hypothetical protein